MRILWECYFCLFVKSQFNLVTLYVWISTSTKGKRRLKISHRSIIFTYEVVGSEAETLMNNVTKIRRTDKLTVTTASKKKDLNQFVAWPITFNKKVGMKMVNKFPSSRRPRTTLITIASSFLGICILNNIVVRMKYWVNSVGPRLECPLTSSLT